MRYVDETLTETRSFEPGLGTFGWVDDGSGAGTTMPDMSTVAHYHSDLIGTTRRTSDATGAGSPGGGGSPAGSVTYTAFGERISGTPSDRYGYASSWGYQSHSMDEVDPPLDPDTALPFLHVGARYYDPATGRFLQRDPIGIAGGFNVYEYVESMPSNAVDPDGLLGMQDHWHWPPFRDDTDRRVRKRGHKKAVEQVDNVVALCIGAPWMPSPPWLKIPLWLYGWGGVGGLW